MQKLDSNFFILTARPAAEREKAVANIRQFLGMPDIPIEYVCSRFNSKPDDSGTNYNSPASETYEAARFSFTVDPKTNYIVETGEADADRERKWMAHAGLKTCHYPEKGVRLATDILIPKPYEVHHHIAYFELDQAMGWGVAIPAVPFSLEEGDWGALKWNDLKADPRRSIIFDWDAMLSMDVNSAPYVQYTYARAASLLEGADLETLTNTRVLPEHETEKALVKLVAEFPEAVKAAAQSYIIHLRLLHMSMSLPKYLMSFTMNFLC